MAVPQELQRGCAHRPEEALQPLWGCGLFHSDDVSLLVRQHSWRQVMAVDGAGHHLQRQTVVSSGDVAHLGHCFCHLNRSDTATCLSPAATPTHSSSPLGWSQAVVQRPETPLHHPNPHAFPTPGISRPCVIQTCSSGKARPMKSASTTGNSMRAAIARGSRPLAPPISQLITANRPSSLGSAQGTDMP